MRTASGSLAAYVAANVVAWRADLFTLTLLSGAVYRWTSWDTDLVVGGNTFSSCGGPNAPVVERSRARQSVKLEVDNMDLTLAGPFTFAGKALGLAGAQGAFDGARLKLDQLIMPRPADVSLGTVDSWFEGRVAGLDPAGYRIRLRVKSELEALNVLVPKFFFGPGCGNTVYDANCGVVRSTFTVNGTVAGVPTAQGFDTNLLQATNWFAQGVIAFTSGALNGTRRSVSVHVSTAGHLTMAIALPQAPAAGDTFSIYPGCDRVISTCLSKFNNLVAIRSYPYIPSSDGGM